LALDSVAQCIFVTSGHQLGASERDEQRCGAADAAHMGCLQGELEHADGLVEASRD